MRKEGVKRGVSSSSQKEASLFTIIHRDPESSNYSILMCPPWTSCKEKLSQMPLGRT